MGGCYSQYTQCLPESQDQIFKCPTDHWLIFFESGRCSICKQSGKKQSAMINCSVCRYGICQGCFFRKIKRKKKQFLSKNEEELKAWVEKIIQQQKSCFKENIAEQTMSRLEVFLERRAKLDTPIRCQTQPLPQLQKSAIVRGEKVVQIFLQYLESYLNLTILLSESSSEKDQD